MLFKGFELYILVVCVCFLNKTLYECYPRSRYSAEKIKKTDL